MKVGSKNIFLGALILSACSTSGDLSRHKPVEFSTVEKLELGKVGAEELKQALGPPSQTLHWKDDLDIWIYDEGEADRKIQKLSVSVDRKTSKILSTSWVLTESDDLHNQDVALAHFSNAKFKVTDVGWIAKHEYSGEQDYNDPQRGISLRLTPATRTVQAISFSAPRDRIPSAQN